MQNDNLDRYRLNRAATHLVELGPRATAELLAELADAMGGLPPLLAVLAPYNRLTPSMMTVARADRVVAPPLRAVA